MSGGLKFIQKLERQTWYDEYDIATRFVNGVKELAPKMFEFNQPVPHDSALAFPTLSGQAQDPKKRSKNNDGPKTPCLCGLTHRWADCPYLNQDARQQGWKPDERIEAEVTRKRKDNPDLSKRIELEE